MLCCPYFNTGDTKSNYNILPIHFKILRFAPLSVSIPPPGWYNGDTQQRQGACPMNENLWRIENDEIHCTLSDFGAALRE
jgi:hypothetical protein